MTQSKWKNLSSWDGGPNTLPKLGGLRFPANIDALAEFLDQTYQPRFHHIDCPTNLYVTVGGDDVNGDGTIDAPFHTIQRALQRIGMLNPSNVTINLGAGSFALPASLANVNWVTLKGAMSELETRNIIEVASQTDAAGIQLRIEGADEGADALRGTLVQWGANQPAASAYGWIFENGIQSPTNGPVSVRVTQDDTEAVKNSTANHALKLLAQDTTLTLPATTHISNCVQLNVEGCRVVGATGSEVLYVLNSDKVNFLRCKFEGFARLQMGRFGAAFLMTSYVRTSGSGAFKDKGVLAVVNQGEVQLGAGTVIDCEVAQAAEKFVSLNGGAKCAYKGEVVFRELGASGIEANGSYVHAVDALVERDTFRFHDCTSAFRVNASDASLGGMYRLPHLRGASLGMTYAVSAQRGAMVSLGPSSNLTGVSADGGTSSLAQHLDGTMISNGNVPLLGAITSDEKAALAGTSGSPSAANLFVTTTDARLLSPVHNAIQTGAVTSLTSLYTSDELAPNSVYLLFWNLSVNAGPQASTNVYVRLVGRVTSTPQLSANLMTFSGNGTFTETGHLLFETPSPIDDASYFEVSVDQAVSMKMRFDFWRMP